MTPDPRLQTAEPRLQTRRAAFQVEAMTNVLCCVGPEVQLQSKTVFLHTLLAGHLQR